MEAMEPFFALLGVGLVAGDEGHACLSRSLAPWDRRAVGRGRHVAAVWCLCLPVPQLRLVPASRNPWGHPGEPGMPGWQVLGGALAGPMPKRSRCWLRLPLRWGRPQEK